MANDLIVMQCEDISPVRQHNLARLAINRLDVEIDRDLVVFLDNHARDLAAGIVVAPKGLCDA
ncbi:hypothetical protein [Roseobacter sp. A03A-229]